MILPQLSGARSQCFGAKLGIHVSHRRRIVGERHGGAPTLPLNSFLARMIEDGILAIILYLRTVAQSGLKRQAQADNAGVAPGMGRRIRIIRKP